MSTTVNFNADDEIRVTALETNVSHTPFVAIFAEGARSDCTVTMTPEQFEAIGRQWASSVQCDTGYAGHCAACDLAAAADLFVHSGLALLKV